MSRHNFWLVASLVLLFGCKDNSSAPGEDRGLSDDRAGTDQKRVDQQSTSTDSKKSDSSRQDSLRHDSLRRDFFQYKDQEVFSCDPSCQAAKANMCVNQSGECVECLKDGHCQVNPGSLGPFCDTANYSCICQGDNDCKTNLRGKHCVGDFLKLCSCQSDSECTSTSFPVCSHRYGPLVCSEKCTSNSDCLVQLWPICNVQTGKCGECLDAMDCSDSYQVCDSAGDCIKCTTSADCADSPYGTVCSNGICTCNDANDCPKTGHPFGNKCIQMTTTRKRCGCDSSADCTGSPAGPTCDSGGSQRCTCASAAECQTAPYTKCTPYSQIPSISICQTHN